MPNGFRHVIVGAKVQRVDLSAFVAAAREDDDGHSRPRRPQASDYLQTIEVRQAQIEEHHLGGVLGDCIERTARCSCL